MASTFIAIFGGGALISTMLTILYNRQKNLAERRKLDSEREKIKADTQGAELENVIKMQKILEQMTEPLKVKIQQLEAKVDEMRPYMCKKENCSNRFFS